MDNTPATHPLWQPVVDTPCAQGASPFWHPQQERLYWLDTVMRRIWRLHVPSGQAESWDVPQEPGSLAPCRSGNLLIALRDGIYSSTTWRDIPQPLAQAPFDTAHTGFGAGLCDPWGRFWIGTNTDHAQPGSLYCLHKRNRPQPELLAMAPGAGPACGLAWSPDGRTLYRGDTLHQQLSLQALSQPGQWPPRLGAAMPFGHLQGRTPGGAAVDKAGNYWLALPGSAAVVCLSPNGDTVAEYPTPAQYPTALCFGGKDLRTLYLTTARVGRGASELAQYPGSGLVFAMRVNNPGLPANPYED